MKKLINYLALCLGWCVVVGAVWVACTKCERSNDEESFLTQAIAKDSEWLREVNYS